MSVHTIDEGQNKQNTRNKQPATRTTKNSKIEDEDRVSGFHHFLTK